MISIVQVPSLGVEPGQFETSFNREPFALEHNLSGLDLFAPEALHDLAQRYVGHAADFFVAGSAPTPSSRFYSVRHGQYAPHEAIERLADVGQRVLLKRPEKYHPGFAELLHALFAQVVALRGGRQEVPVRLTSSIFITSAASITPFHFDPEITFFFQIEGAKIYHVYSPQTVTEKELEQFYKRGALDIGQLDLTGRDPTRETVYALAPKLGFHQPEHTPHWVETGAARSISYAISFETASTRRAGRARAFNHYARAVGFTPGVPGIDTELDGRKARAMDVVLPVRQFAATLARRIARR